MASIFEVSPFDGGWCMKIADTGEVLFFTARRQAITRARTLARLWPQTVSVKVRPRRALALIETWAPNELATPLGTSA
jgi:hypothetical protein